MKRTTYNKLIRDKIPEVIKNNGASCFTRELNQSDYVSALETKLCEELKELLLATNSDKLEELADLLEVIYALTAAYGFSPDELDIVRRDKTISRGSFQKRLFLEWTEE